MGEEIKGIKGVLLGDEFEYEGVRYVARAGYGGEGFVVDEPYWMKANGKNIKVFGCEVVSGRA